MKNRSATWIHLVFATIVVVAVPLQVYFIASYFSGAGEGARDAHGFTGGFVVHASEAIVFLASLVAFWGFWRWIGWSFLLILLGTVQIFLAPPTRIRPAAGCTAFTGSVPCSCSCWPHSLPTTTCASWA
jgi:hypothetical protein